eukprot:gene7223-5076_t
MADSLFLCQRRWVPPGRFLVEFAARDLLTLSPAYFKNITDPFTEEGDTLDSIHESSSSSVSKDERFRESACSYLEKSNRGRQATFRERFSLGDAVPDHQARAMRPGEMRSLVVIKDVHPTDWVVEEVSKLRMEERFHYNGRRSSHLAQREPISFSTLD